MKQFITTVFNVLKPLTEKLVTQSQRTTEQNWYNDPESDENATKMIKSQVPWTLQREVIKLEDAEERKKFWTYPVKIRRITSPSGWRLILKKRQWHNGVDYTGQNTTAQAPTDMLIRKVLKPDAEYPVQFRWNHQKNEFEQIPDIPKGRAWTPYIEAICLHDKTITFVFRHVEAIALAGETVTVGTDFCKIGNYGYSMGAHMHFELYKDGKEMDGDAFITAQIARHVKA